MSGLESQAFEAVALSIQQKIAHHHFLDQMEIQYDPMFWSILSVPPIDLYSAIIFGWLTSIFFFSLDVYHLTGCAGVVAEAVEATVMTVLSFHQQKFILFFESQAILVLPRAVLVFFISFTEVKGHIFGM